MPSRPPAPRRSRSTSSSPAGEDPREREGIHDFRRLKRRDRAPDPRFPESCGSIDAGGPMKAGFATAHSSPGAAACEAETLVSWREPEAPGTV